MSLKSHHRNVPAKLLPSLAGILVVIGSLTAWKFLSTPQAVPSAAAPVVSPATAPAAVPDDPSPSFEVTRRTADGGGDQRERELSINWLDTQARSAQPLSDQEATWLLDTLRSGGHPAWESSYRQWFFNSAFNALHASTDPEPLTRLLADLARTDSDPTMRLYALQHIGTQRNNGRFSEALASEIRTTLQNLLARDPATAGTVIELLASWDGGGTPTDPATRHRAAAMAEDQSLSADVRVTALHAAGPDSLPGARRLATDPNQPVHLRKAAIACIGRHGCESDLPDLEKLSRESSRLAQAANPARATIQHRLTHPNAPVPVPF